MLGLFYARASCMGKEAKKAEHPPLTAYLRFCEAKRDEWGNQLTLAELGRMWQLASSTEKRPFRKAYKKERAEWEARRVLKSGSWLSPPKKQKAKPRKKKSKRACRSVLRLCQPSTPARAQEQLAITMADGLLGSDNGPTTRSKGKRRASSSGRKLRSTVVRRRTASASAEGGTTEDAAGDESDASDGGEWLPGVGL